jgi:hypothetical protein
MSETGSRTHKISAIFAKSMYNVYPKIIHRNHKKSRGQLYNLAPALPWMFGSSTQATCHWRDVIIPNDLRPLLAQLLVHHASASRAVESGPLRAAARPPMGITILSDKFYLIAIIRVVLYDCTDFTSPQIVLRHILRQYHNIQQLDLVFHQQPDSASNAPGIPRGAWNER